MSQLGQLTKDRSIYEEKGAQIIAVAVQSQEAAVLSAERSKAQYPILADSEHTVAQAYGVTQLSLGLVESDESDWAKSGGAVFVIDSDGQIVWEYLAKSFSDRAPSQTILENLP